MCVRKCINTALKNSSCHEFSQDEKRKKGRRKNHEKFEQARKRKELIFTRSLVFLFPFYILHTMNDLLRIFFIIL